MRTRRSAPLQFYNGLLRHEDAVERIYHHSGRVKLRFRLRRSSAQPRFIEGGDFEVGQDLVAAGRFAALDGFHVAAAIVCEEHFRA